MNYNNYTHHENTNTLARVNPYGDIDFSLKFLQSLCRIINITILNILYRLITKPMHSTLSISTRELIFLTNP